MSDLSTETAQQRDEARIDAPAKVTRAWKGFGPDFKCMTHQYEVGQAYSIDGAIGICERGFHACTTPLDVLDYYPAAASRYAEVILIGETRGSRDGDSKLCAREIRIIREISYHDLHQAHREWLQTVVKEATGYRCHASATGYRCHASATGYGGHASATGYRGHASATGDRGHASAPGDSGHASATGKNSIAAVLGGFGRAKASAGNWIVLAQYDNQFHLVAVKTARCGDGPADLRPDTWHRLNEAGEFETCE